MSSIIVNANNITDTVNNSTFQVDFDRSVETTGKHIALLSASLYFSWRNITTSNNTFSYIWIDDVEYSITIPIGFYEVSDILSYFQYVMKINGHIMTNTSTSEVVYFIDLVVSNTLYSIDILTYPVPDALPDGYTASFTFPATAKNPILILPSGINEIFDYDADFQTDSASEIKIYNSTQAPNVSPDSTVILVCDQVQNDFSNLGILYAITPSVGIGSLITDKPSFPIYSSLKSGTFNQLTFRILSAKTYRPIEIIDPEIHLIFSIKDKGQ